MWTKLFITVLVYLLCLIKICNVSTVMQSYSIYMRRWHMWCIAVKLSMTEGPYIKHSVTQNIARSLQQLSFLSVLYVYVVEISTCITTTVTNMGSSSGTTTTRLRGSCTNSQYQSTGRRRCPRHGWRGNSQCQSGRQHCVDCRPRSTGRRRRPRHGWCANSQCQSGNY